jgi:hypothetical protein
MIDAIRKIEIKDFIRILILELNEEEYVYFVDSYNEKYFYVKDNNELCTHQSIYTYYKLYFSKANTIYRDNLDKLKKDVYDLHRQLTFSLPRAKRNAKYYFIDMNFEVQECEERNDYADNIIYNSFNYFVSEEEATKCSEKLKEYLIELRKEEALKGE